MQMKDLITEEIEALPPRFMIYGVGGIGKTELAAAFPKPVFLRVENGSFAVKAAKTPHIETLEEFELWLNYFAREDHPYKTVVVDTIDEVERMKCLEICSVGSCETIMQYKGGFGKGTGALISYFQSLRYKLDALQKRGMIVVLLAHNSVEKANDPMTEPYDRHVPDLYKDVVPMMKDWADCTFFINYKIIVRQKEDSGKKTYKPQASEPDRIIYTQERPSFVAKNRYSLPFEISYHDPSPSGNPREAGRRAAKRVVDEIISTIKDYLAEVKQDGEGEGKKIEEAA